MAASGEAGEYKGISRDGEKFQAKIVYADETLYVGRYARSVEAAYAFDFAHTVLNPGSPEPNDISAAALTAEERHDIEENVMRLLHPRRAPYQRDADEA